MRRCLGVGGAVALLTLGPAVPANAGGEEEAVRAALEGMNVSYNRADFDGFAAHLCADMLTSPAFVAGWYQSRSADGPTRITVNSVSVRGEPPSHALANVRFVAADHDKTLDIEFLREGSQWKACRYETGQAV
ncbi:Rv0361 family membrane protein [Mycobacterium sp. IDR2000157661]|uniref:Rv0361 family membrane protein n=1 Tax=Mycobacterium sp. IDR2000157661 TaxID=2867005 RepID=UPI001EEBB46F|nr:transcriptional regulator [Mycobacterium sp. IDR2000157661]ULE34328.1 transcriptional regulator [Mycobacterium sp. IDR2000157661]